MSVLRRQEIKEGAQTDTATAPSDEERAIRDAVAGIAGSFGPDYYQQQVDDGGHCAELWDALGAKGYLCVRLPERYGGGGLGLREIAVVVQETAMAGCPLQAMLFSAGVTGTILDRTASDQQKSRWLPGSIPSDCHAPTNGCHLGRPCSLEELPLRPASATGVVAGLRM